MSKLLVHKIIGFLFRPFQKENILFLDDAIENIDAALNVGIKAKQVNGYDLDYIKSCVNEFLNE